MKLTVSKRQMSGTRSPGEGNSIEIAGDNEWRERIWRDPVQMMTLTDPQYCIVVL